jgi:hypothetical protein
LGFGVYHFHGVCHVHFLENVAALAHESAFLGTLSLMPGMIEVDQYLKAVAFSSEHVPNAISIVSSSIALGYRGRIR